MGFCFLFLFFVFVPWVKIVGVLIIAIAVFSATKLEIERWNWNNAFSFPLGKQVVLLAVYLPGRPSKGIIDCSYNEQCPG